MESLNTMGQKAKKAAFELSRLNVTGKNEALRAAAKALTDNEERILAANAVDIENGVKNNMNQGLLDRLKLTSGRIQTMAEGLLQVADLDDPVGEVLSMKKRPNGLIIGTKRVPLGVIGIIFESRPNVTADAFALCFKTGNAVILRGGSDAIHSNTEIVAIINEALKNVGISYDVLQLITDTDRGLVKELLRMNEYIDVIIPRGGAGLIKMVVENSTVPVIETGTGNCHIFVDESADFDMALDIIENAKTQRIGVCNACESLVIHEKIAKEFIPLVTERLKKHNVEIRGDETARSCDSRIIPASEEDWGCEYLDYIISVKTVSSIDEAVLHINRYNTGHSEAIITNDYEHSQKFLEEIDAACVYVNASTRFTDGFEFGFGAEIGISTQKLHARGPMGLKELTTTKYIVYGNGQVRE